MRNKHLRVVLLSVCLALPVTVYASWQLGIRVMSGGGQMQVGSDPPYRSADGAIYKTYTTSQNVPIVCTADSGYKISSYAINGTTYAAADATTSLNYNMGQLAYPGNTSQTTTVTFIPWMTSVTVNSGDSGGSVSPSGTSSLQLGTSKSYTFSPTSGNQVVAFDGLPASGYTLSPATIPAAINQAVTLTLTVPATPLTITGYFLGVVANAGSTQYVMPGTTVTLDGSGSSIRAGGGTLSYAWTQTGGTAVTLSDATAAKPTFSTAATGTYNFKLTVTNGSYTNSATTAVNVITSAAATARSMCGSCHQASNVGVTQNVFPNWSSSTHEQKLVMCANCHVGADTGGHPGNLTSGTVNETTFTFNAMAAPRTGSFCFTCHHKGNNLHFNTEAQLANICVACHTPDVHNPAATISLALGAQHFNGYTSAGNANFRAAYVTPAGACADCHLTTSGMPNASDPALLQERLDWSNSGHANQNGAAWLAADFKTRSGCVQCHTVRGFIAYSSARMTAAWGMADPTRGVLACNGCHADLASGALRSSPPLQPYANDSYLNPDLGMPSNLCLRCHSGSQSGRTIKALAAGGADFTNLAFVSPHSSAAAGILFKAIGYEFAGRDYSNKWHFKHDRIGIGHYTAYGYDTGADGPCVGCHMSAANRHSFSPLAKDAGGAVTAVTSPACAGCHTGPAYLDASRMNVRKTKLATVLLALQKVLETKGFYYADSDPYFFRSSGTTDPANAVTNWGNADTMGAAFNFSLLRHEPGAYAHNMVYAKRLLYDSIDYLDNGLPDNSVNATINGLTGLDAGQKATAIGYLSPTGARP